MKTTAKPMTKWLLSLVFALVVISLLILPQLLKVESHADYARTGISEGDTTIHISTGGQLAQLIVRTQKDKCTWKGKTIVLDNDISMRSVSTQPTLTVTSSSFGQCTSSGSFTRPEYNNSDNGNKGRIDDSWNYCVTFEGVFDGQGHTVTGLYTYKNSGGDGKWNGLLFDRLTGTVKNVCFKDCTIEYDHPKENSDSSLGLIGGVASGGVVENVYVDSTVTYITHRTATGNYLRTIGGIAGWVDGGTLRNCAAFPTVISANGQGNLNYPFNGTARITIGGVAGAIESTSTVTNCIGGGTYYSNVTERSFMGVTESYSNPGWNLACPATLGSQTKTLSNIKEGYTTTAPDSSWVYYAPFGTYLPSGIGTVEGTTTGSGLFYLNASISNYNTNYRGSYYLITSKSDYTTMISKVNSDGQYGKYMNFKLTADIDFGGTTQVTLSATGGTVSLPSSSKNNYSQFNYFNGLLDGDGHVIKNAIAKQIVYNSSATGCFAAATSGCTVKNLAFVDCIFIGDHRNNGSADYTSGDRNSIFGALIGKADGSVTLQNLYVDADIWLITHYSYGFGGLIGDMNAVCTIKDVTMTGRFSVCDPGTSPYTLTNTSFTQARASTSSCANGLIAAYGYSGSTVTNFLFSGMRYTTVPNNNNVNSNDQFIHWDNSSQTLTNCSISSTVSGSNMSRIWTAKDPSSGLGSTYKYLRNTGHYVLATNYTTFQTALDSSYTLPILAQVGSSSDRVRIVAKLPKCMAQNASTIGFKITRSTDSKTATVPLTGVYKNISVNGSTKAATDISGKGDYLFAIAISGVPSGCTLTIKPYVIVNSTTYDATTGSYKRS